ncbi:sulfite exporter TauE/SafE family protein (plasmid) [Arthrobacter sp. YA7-1]|uniref:sulfite exporter TauE/SafE family protein n=1 Tax=Arthrobacter sp. YA7-1 TaxID=2987701 RepID=UPI0022272BEA|nr:sulfite exporter TauE/SafE family protein [Arthrobacter sp. YA7-1]UYY83584.1 sulfite exporter TauE/SafE family protein [Arthrobacter sp. YA7-1]
MTGTLLILAVLMGSAMQRLTGLGFALVAAPFLVLLIGPVNGVILVNICGAVTSASVLVRVFRHVQWRKYAVLAPSALIGIIPGAVIVHYVPGAWLELSVGALVILSLTIGLTLRSPRRRNGLPPLVLAGSVSGLMNTTAGVGGPALSVYAIMTRWEQIPFAATMQPYFLTIGITSVTAKLLAQPSSMPQLPPWIWVSMAGAIVLGLFAGEALAKRMPAKSARRLMVLLAYIGSIAAAARGIWELLGL